MKKLLMVTAAAVAITSSPAMAADWKGKDYGQDAIGWYDLKADVETFCKFGTNNDAGLSFRATVTPGAPGSAAEADGTFDLDIQDPDDNTVRAATGTFLIKHAVCNTPFQMKVTSTNGGLKTTASTSDSAFTSEVPYLIVFNFDGKVGASTSGAAQGGNVVRNVNEARAGSAFVNVSVLPRDELLLEGVYADRLVAELIPNVGA